VVFPRCANKQSIPWLFSAGNGEVEPAVQVCGIEAEELSQDKSRIVFEGFKYP
jgi:hypothetical protein